MNKEKIVEKYNLSNWNHAVLLAVTMALTLVGLVYTIYELTTAAGNVFKTVRILVSLAFFAAAMIFTPAGYKHAGLMRTKILILFRIAGVILNIISCMIYSTIVIQWWVYAYLYIILIGLVVFFAVLNRPKAAYSVIAILIVTAFVYSIARMAVYGQSLLEAFRPVLFEWIIAVIYWSKNAREEVKVSMGKSTI